MFFDHYPYTNFHNVNLDWVLQAVKSWGALVEANNREFIDLKAANESFKQYVTNNFDQLVASNESFKDYVTNYLENLDVSEEINNKLDQMLTSGALTPYMQPYIQTGVNTWLDQHITPTTPAVDSSLTISGAAADSATVGKMFTSIETGLSSIFKTDKQRMNWSDTGTSARPLGWREGYYSSSTGAFSTSEHYISTFPDSSKKIKALLQHADKMTVIPPAGYTMTITAFDAPYTADTHNIVFRTETTIRMNIEINHSYYYVFTIGRFDDNAASFVTETFLNTVILDYYNDYDNVSPLSTFNVGMFSKIGICGYSWDAGYYYLPGGSVHYTRPEKSWGAILARKWGIEYGCYAVPSGTSVKPNSTYPTISWQENVNGLPALLADTPCDLYFLHMFGNDLTRLGLNYLGTIEDITEDYTNNPDTYYGNMGRIIEQIKAHAPNALIVLSYNYYDRTGYDEYYNAIQAIANHYGVPVIDWYSDGWYASQMNKFLISSHPTIASYSAMAEAAGRLLAKCIETNWDYFKAYNA